MRNVDYPIIWKHLLHSGVTHYCAAPTVEESVFPYVVSPYLILSNFADWNRE